jgi:hypothetical protein
LGGELARNWRARTVARLIRVAACTAPAALLLTPALLILDTDDAIPARPLDTCTLRVYSMRMASQRKNFVLTDHDQALLTDVARALGGASQTDSIRWGLTLLRQLLYEGDAAWERLADGRRAINLRGERGRSLLLVERKDGPGFYFGAEGGAVGWFGEHPEPED